MSDSRAAAWNRLQQVAPRRLEELFAADPDRVAKLSPRLEWGEGAAQFDWSKTHLDDALLDG